MKADKMIQKTHLLTNGTKIQAQNTFDSVVEIIQLSDFHVGGNTAMYLILGGENGQISGSRIDIVLRDYNAYNFIDALTKLILKGVYITKVDQLEETFRVSTGIPINSWRVQGIAT